MKTGQDIINAAKSLLNYTNYKLGAKYYNYNNNINKPKLLDCSGFVVWCYRQAGFTVPDGTYMQWQESEPVSLNNIQIGDIGILKEGGVGTYNHVGIYAGNGQWIHCNYSRNGVTLEKTNIFKYPRRFKNVKFLEDTATDKTTKSNKGSDEVIRTIKIKSGSKIPTINSINVENREYASLRDLAKLGIIKLDYDKENKMPIIEKAD